LQELDLNQQHIVPQTIALPDWAILHVSQECTATVSKELASQLAALYFCSPIGM
jgi:hypothetical protein